MRLVGERTRQTGLQVEGWFLLRSRGPQGARVAGENKRSFLKRGERNRFKIL